MLRPPAARTKFKLAMATDGCIARACSMPQAGDHSLAITLTVTVVVSVSQVPRNVIARINVALVRTVCPQPSDLLGLRGTRLRP